MVISLTPQQFQGKLEALRVKGLKLLENGRTGMLVSSDVALSYSYDGVGSLTISILQKRSLRAKIATKEKIEESVEGIFSAL